MKKNYDKVILHEEVSINAKKLCEELYEQAREKGPGSGAVDHIEWKAANVIHKLLTERCTCGLTYLERNELIDKTPCTRSQREDIIADIMKKMWDFELKYGKRPSWLYLSRDHYRTVLQSLDYQIYLEINPRDGKPETILGMKYRVKDDQVEIEVQ